MANDRTVSIGGSVTASAISVGDGASAAAGRSRAASAPRPEASLAAIGEALARLEALDPRVESRLDAARDIASRPEPNKTAVAKLVGEGLAYAKASDGFAQAYDHVVPHVEALAHWLGSAAAHLPSLLP